MNGCCTKALLYSNERQLLVSLRRAIANIRNMVGCREMEVHHEIGLFRYKARILATGIRARKDLLHS